MTDLGENLSLRLAAPWLLALLSACSSDPAASAATGGSTGTSSGGATGTCATGTSVTSTSASLVGTFRAELIAANPELDQPGYTKFIGRVFDGPTPSVTQLKVDLEQDGCQLLVPVLPFCSPSCGAAGVCTAENVCTPYPNPQSVGCVHLTGLGPSEIVMGATPAAFVYQPGGSENLPNPPCSEGAKISLQAENFGIESECIAPLTVPGNVPIPVSSGKGVPLTWTPPEHSGMSRISLKLQLAFHGGEKGEIDCDVADTGAFEIPEPLVTKLVGLGLAGFPTVVIGRYSSGLAATQRQVKLLMLSSIERAVDTGVKSCMEDKDCPSGSCKQDLSCE